MQDEGSQDVILAVPLGTVCHIAEKAQELQVKAGSSASGAGVDEDEPEAAILEDRGVDPVESELISIISNLSEDGQVDLVALMWLGRDPGDWAEMREIAQQEHTDRTAEYLCRTPLLANYLLDGLNALGFDCQEWQAESFEPPIGRRPIGLDHQRLRFLSADAECNCDSGNSDRSCPQEQRKSGTSQ